VELLNRIGIITAFTMALYNCIYWIAYSKPLIMLFTHVLIWPIVGIVLLKNKRKIVHAIIFLLVGFITIALGYQGNPSGIIFIIFGTQLINKIDIKIIIFIISGAAMVCKGIALKLDVGQFMILVVGSAIIGAYYYALNVKVKPKISIAYKNDKEKIILDMVTQNMNAKTIAHKLNISQNMVNKYIKCVRDRSGCETNGALFWNLSQLVNKKNNNDTGGI